VLKTQTEKRSKKATLGPILLLILILILLHVLDDNLIVLPKYTHKTENNFFFLKKKKTENERNLYTRRGVEWGTRGWAFFRGSSTMGTWSSVSGSAASTTGPGGIAFAASSSGVLFVRQ
jgi:hypothetical protein